MSIRAALRMEFKQEAYRRRMRRLVLHLDFLYLASPAVEW